MQVDASGWSGEGEFTQTLLDALKQFEDIHLIRVEDAPASRAETGYAFISNEVFVGFRTRERVERVRRFGFFPVRRRHREQGLTLAGVSAALETIAEVGPPDYQDDGMLQYLRAQRIVPPYQTRGYKVVEMVRIYEAGRQRVEGPA
jgi:hypothetical protein